MANWEHTLNIKDEWKMVKNNEMQLKDFIKVVIRKLKRFNLDDAELLSIIDDFEILASQDDPEVDEFDCIWNELYDWADELIEPFGYPTNKKCWIATL
jgi:hypothetical protein